jgi:hypothetical protein
MWHMGLYIRPNGLLKDRTGPTKQGQTLLVLVTESLPEYNLIQYRAILQADMRRERVIADCEIKHASAARPTACTCVSMHRRAPTKGNADLP